MSEENLRTLARIYEGWAQGDFAVGLDAFGEEPTLVIHSEIPDAGEYVGLDGIRAYMRRFLEAWDSLTIAAESVQDAGDRVLVKVRQTGVGWDSGAAVSQTYFQIWTFSGGAVTRLESVWSERKARVAAGLPQAASE